MNLKSDRFPDSELLRYTDGLPLILSPNQPISVDQLALTIASRRDELRQKLVNHGALLFRGCGVVTVEDFHKTLEAMGIEPCEPGIYFGEVTRAATGPHTMVATKVPPNFVIGPHNEADYWYEQPEFISFFCEATDCTYGQTPLIDGAGVAKALSKDLRALFEDQLLVSEYIFDSAESTSELVGGQKRNVWQTMFSTSHKAEVENILDARDDVDFSWGEHDTLRIQVTKPAFGTHPITGQQCFRANRYNDFTNVKYMLTKLARAQMPWFQYLITHWVLSLTSWVASLPWVKHEKYAWKTRFLEGKALTKSQEQTLAATLFDHSTIFRWHKGDVLIVDNIRVAHGRLNVDSDRTIHVFLSKYFAQEKLTDQPVPAK